MSAELIGILGLGAALAGLILRGQHQTNKRLDKPNQRNRCINGWNAGWNDGQTLENVQTLVSPPFEDDDDLVDCCHSHG